MTVREKWSLAKTETGQSRLVSPQFIKDGDKFYTKKLDIAQSMNRQFLKQIRDTQDNIPVSHFDPLEQFEKSFRTKPPTFSIQQINMSQLRKNFSSMSPTALTTTDYISMKTIKQSRKQLEPQLLNLKTTKVIPIPKPPKNIEKIEGWRPINIVPAISKIIDKCFMIKMVTHLNDNKLEPFKSTKEPKQKPHGPTSKPTKPNDNTTPPSHQHYHCTHSASK